MPVEAPPKSRKEHLLANSRTVLQERKKLAERMMLFRSEHDIPRRVLAVLVGCSQTNIQCIENEESAPSYALAVTIEKLLTMKAHSVRRLIKEKGIEL